MLIVAQRAPGRSWRSVPGSRPGATLSSNHDTRNALRRNPSKYELMDAGHRNIEVRPETKVETKTPKANPLDMIGNSTSATVEVKKDAATLALGFG